MDFRRLRAMIVLSILASAPATAQELIRDVQIEATIQRSGNFLGEGFGSIWMMSSGRLARIDQTSSAVVDIPIPGGAGVRFRGMAVAEGAVWLPDVEYKTIHKIDPKTNRVVLAIAADMVGGSLSEGSIGAGDGAVWAVTGPDNGVLTRYSAAIGKEEATIALPSRSSDVLVAFGSVWVTGTGNDELYRVDPATNRIATTTELRARPRAMVAEGGSVWVWNEGDGTVQRIDGKTAKVLATIDTGAVGKAAMAAGGGFVWINSRLVPLIQIDPHTDSVRGKFKAELHEYSTIRYGGGSLWISGSVVSRIKPPG